MITYKFISFSTVQIYELSYNRTSRKQPPKMLSGGGRLQELRWIKIFPHYNCWDPCVNADAMFYSWKIQFWEKSLILCFEKFPFLVLARNAIMLPHLIIHSSNPFLAWIFSGFNFTTAQVVCLTVMINHKFISFSAVHIYDFSYILQ